MPCRVDDDELVVNPPTPCSIGKHARQHRKKSLPASKCHAVENARRAELASTRQHQYKTRPTTEGDDGELH